MFPQLTNNKFILGKRNNISEDEIHIGQKMTKYFAIAAIVLTFASGCRSTDEYKKFAKAGNNFVTATDNLLDAAGDITINTTSERVLSDRRSTGELKPGDEKARNFIRRYNEFSKKDKERLALIKELRKHNQFLKAYFEKIIELADSKSSERTKVAVESITKNLQESGSKLVKLSPVKIDKLPSFTKIILDARIRGVLREELEKRKYTIYQEIIIQEKILAIISDSIENELEIMRDLKEYRLVVKPLLNSKNFNETTWITARYEVLKQNTELLSKIKNASDTLAKFKEIFIASIKGERNSKRLNKFIQETNAFSAFVSEHK